MTVRLRPYLAALAIAGLAYAMTVNWGFFIRNAGAGEPDGPVVTPAALMVAAGALGLALLTCSLPERRRPGAPPDGRPADLTGLLAVLALALSGYGACHAEVLSARYWPEQVTAAAGLLPWAAGFGFLLTASLGLHWLFPGGRWRRLLPAQIALLFLAGGVLRGAAVCAVPEPVIDVYVALRGGPDHLLHGRNPYTAPYQHAYAGEPQEYDRYPFYPPLPILVGVPFRAAGLDVRCADVLCDLLAAWVLLEAGRARGGLLLGGLAAAAYLNFPRAPFVMEQTWFEPMLAATLGGGLLLAERGRRAGYFLLGLGLTGKQYGVVLLLPLVKALWRRRWALALGVAGAAALVILPFLLWDARAFLDTIFWVWFKRPPRDDALTLRNAADFFFGQHPSGKLSHALGWLTAAWVAWRTPAAGVAAAFWMGTALLAFCYLHSQAFFNYFYLCGYLFLLGLVGMAGPTARSVGE